MSPPRAGPHSEPFFSSQEHGDLLGCLEAIVLARVAPHLDFEGLSKVERRKANEHHSDEMAETWAELREVLARAAVRKKAELKEADRP